MYLKPKLERFGSVRELTKIGLDQDCDGGVLGVPATDGGWALCHSEDRS